MLNPQKCKTFTMTLKRKPLIIEYVCGNAVLENVESIRDLGVILDRRLTFSRHVDAIVSGANRALGLLMRSLQTGQKAGTLNSRCEPIVTAYYGNVRSVLEFCCTVWGGAARVHLDRIEKGQHRFLVWLARYARSSLVTGTASYHDLLHGIHMTSLEHRRLQYDIVFAKKVFMGRVDSTKLLQSFSLRVPARTMRSTLDGRRVMEIPFARVETIYRRGLFVRISKRVNSFLTVRSMTLSPYSLERPLLC